MISYMLKTIRNFGNNYHDVLAANNRPVSIDAIPAAYRDFFNQAAQEHREAMNRDSKIESLERRMVVRK